MNRFLSQAQFVRHFPTSEDSLIQTVGYDDFRFVKPLYAERVQSFYTWHFVVSGAGALQIGGKIWDVDQGKMFFIPPGEKMCYFPKDDNPWEYVWFSLNGKSAERYGEMLGFSIAEPVKNYCAHPGIVNRLKKLFLLLSKENGSIFSALSVFYGILEECLMDTVPTGIHAVKKYLDESFTLPGFNVEQLCYDAGISHSHMLRLFKKEFGVSLMQYMIAKRISFACELLTTTDLSVKSVAFSCGFSDEAHFMKTFKKHTGFSALQYRKKG